MQAIYNYPVVPEKSLVPRGPANPLSRKDLGTDFRNAMYFSFWNDTLFRQVFYEARLGSATWTQWYNNLEDRSARKDPSKKGLSVPDWEEMAALHAKHGLFVMFNSCSHNQISKEHHQRMVELFGTRFIGHDEGEWDGAYMHMVFSPPYEGKAGPFHLSPRRSRREACRHYLDWMGKAYADHHRRMFTTSSLLFGCHYAAELGSRMLGLELGESLPCDTLMISFCRGACKQYDLLFATFPAVFSVRGVKIYPRQGQPQSIVMGDSVMGPEHGTTLGLLKRHWWSSYMSGASIIGLQSGYFPTEITSTSGWIGMDVPLAEPVTLAKVKAHFTPLGWLFWECKQTAIRHPYRGVPYVPFAVMLHHDHGWYPQPNIYTGSTVNRVWGNIPYNRGDWQTDRFFQWVYPGYKLASADREIRDERGKWVNTPLGDSFDVILSNALHSCLEKYRAVILAGTWELNAEPEVRRRLEKFVRGGGTVITDTSQWTTLPKDAVREGGEQDIVTEYACGRGRIIMVSEPAWGADRKDGKIFRNVTGLLEKYLREYSLVEIEGRPIYYLVNVTDRPDELMVTLCNNSHGMPWEGMVRIKGEDILEVEEWLAQGEADIQNGGLRCGVPPNDVRIFRLKARRGFLNLRFPAVPWKKLGYGVPEWLAQCE